MQDPNPSVLLLQRCMLKHVLTKITQNIKLNFYMNFHTMNSSKQYYILNPETKLYPFCTTATTHRLVRIILGGTDCKTSVMFYFTGQL